MAKKPIYEQITDYLAELLAGKEVGYELPTIAELCERFGIRGVQTVRDGVEPFVRSGYVRTRQAGGRRWVVVRTVPAPPANTTAGLSQRDHAWAIASLRDVVGEIRTRLDTVDRLVAYLAGADPATLQFYEALSDDLSVVLAPGRQRPAQELSFTHSPADFAL